MTEKLYKEMKKIATEINNFLNEGEFRWKKTNMMIIYFFKNTAEVDNKNYLQLRNNVLVWPTEKRKAHEVKGEEMYNR